MPFRHVKAAYERLREKERLELQKYFLADKKIKDAGLEVIKGPTAGRGVPGYQGDFDLRNWKWVQVKGANGFNCVISLNLPGIAPDTGTPIALYDRVGLVLSADPKDWQDAKIDLPLNGRKRKKIAQLVLEQYKIFCEKKEAK